MLIRCLPLIFAFLWSTGFIGAKYGLPYIEPFSLLAIRFVITLVFLGLIIALLKPGFPAVPARYGQVAVAGLLIHGFYLAGVFVAIKWGMPAGMAAVIVGVQPVLTVLLTNRGQSPRLLLMSAVGFIGLFLVLLREGQADLANAAASLPWTTYMPVVIALIAITLGTLYQKRYCADIHIVTSAFLQYIPTTLFFLVLAYGVERGSWAVITWHPQLIFAILWLVIVLSIGAVMLMNLLYRHHSANTAASYFYLSPPFALMLGYLLFDEAVSAINLLGIVLVAISIYGVTRLQKSID